MRIIFTGSGEFGIPTLQALSAAGHEIPAVFTQPDRPAGRGRKLTPTPVGQFALQHKLPLHPTASINQESLPSADAMVVIAFGQKVGPQAVGHAQFGSLNLHASLLPKYRGAAPINWAILRGETTTGNSVIRLAQKMDAGAISRNLKSLSATWKPPASSTTALPSMEQTWFWLYSLISNPAAQSKPRRMNHRPLKLRSSRETSPK